MQPTYGDDQAFPLPEDENHVRVKGCTKREFFAAMALQGLVSRAGATSPPEPKVEWAVKYADALIEALQK